MTDIDSGLEELVRTVDHLESVNALELLTRRFAHALDRPDPQLLADLFTPEGQLTDHDGAGVRWKKGWPKGKR